MLQQAQAIQNEQQAKEHQYCMMITDVNRSFIFCLFLKSVKSALVRFVCFVVVVVAVVVVPEISEVCTG